MISGAMIPPMTVANARSALRCASIAQLRCSLSVVPPGVFMVTPLCLLWGRDYTTRRLASPRLIRTAPGSAAGAFRSAGRCAARGSLVLGDRRRQAEALVHDRAGRRVLQVLLLTRLEMRGDGKRRERGLVEAAQDQLLLAGIVVDIADREDARHAGLELLRVDADAAAIEVEPPVRDRAELRMQAEEHQQLLGADAACHAVRATNARARKCAVRFQDLLHLSFEVVETPF